MVVTSRPAIVIGTPLEKTACAARASALMFHSALGGGWLLYPTKTDPPMMTMPLILDLS